MGFDGMARSNSGFFRGPHNLHLTGSATRTNEFSASRSSPKIAETLVPRLDGNGAQVGRSVRDILVSDCMRRPFRIFIIIVIGQLLANALHAQARTRSVTEVYAEFCSGCHGTKMEGGKGGSLISGKWKHGSDQASLTRSVRSGYPSAGMPGFSPALDDAQITALVAYIFETSSRHIDPQPQEEEALPTGIRHTEQHAFRFESVAEGLDVPWSLTFLPDDRILVTERVGRLRVIEHGRLLPEPIGGLPHVVVKDEAGLLSVVADPRYSENGWIYLSFADGGDGDGDPAMTKIIRGKLRDHQLVEQEIIFSVPASKYQNSHVLFGGRLAFRDGYLFFSVGERGLEQGSTGQAQDLSLAVGKIHRVLPDGSAPRDNPFVKTPGAVPSIWAYGVRNPQGLAFDPRQGDLWESEHGPRGGDELNRIVRGANYGWPIVTYGMNYDGTPISDKTHAPGMVDPVLYWTPSIAVSEIEFYTGNRFPKWKNNLFVGSLAQQKFLRLVVEKGKVVHREDIFERHGRVRDIKTGPDGFIYLALEFIGKPGRIVRLVPADLEERSFTTKTQRHGD
jgi:glucose/arabinose dehydrogenase